MVTEAIDVMATGTSKVLEYGVSNEVAWEVGLACGGQVKVYVEAVKMKREILNQLERSKI